MKSQNSYFNFLQLAEAVNDAFDCFSEIDPTTMLLLEIIAIMHSDHNALTVTQAMGLISVASPATIHRKLCRLYELKLIDFVFLGANRRTKYLHPTSKAENYFSALGQSLSEAVKIAAISPHA
jgi:DNA-binding MarR family transcriptional regulator